MQSNESIPLSFTPPPQVCVNLSYTPGEHERLRHILNPPKNSCHVSDKIYQPKRHCPWKVVSALGLMFGAGVCAAYFIYHALSQRTVEALGDTPINNTGNGTNSIFNENDVGSGMGQFDIFNNTSKNSTSLPIISEWD